MKLVIVSGLSGSGKSVVLRVLEDLGYYCVDNLPLPLIGALLTQLKDSSHGQIAISIDVRNIPKEHEKVEQYLGELSKDLTLTSFFLDTNVKVLLKRYSETRRLHPLSRNKATLQEAIDFEEQCLKPIAPYFDHHIDTSSLNIYQLSDKIQEILLGRVNEELVINFESFGFKYGMPAEADFMFDVRFLPNPHWEPRLRALTGLDKEVQEFFVRQPLMNKFIWQIEHLLDTWLPHLQRNNRSYLTVAIGCTGGKHRSVYVAEQLAQRFFTGKHKVQAHHRELANDKN